MASGAFKNDYLIAKLELEAKLASSWIIYKNVQKEISKLKAKMTRANQMQTKESSRKVKVVTIEDIIKSIRNYEKAINVLIDKKRSCSRLEAKRIELDIKKKQTQLYKLNKKLGERQT